MTTIPSPTRRAEIEEMFDTVPDAQFTVERQLRATRLALASVERDRARLEREVTAGRNALAKALQEIDELRDVIASQREAVR